MTSVLIVRLGALGDIVHAIPVAAALRRAFPSIHLDWLVSAKHREILELVPVVNARRVINDRGDANSGMSLPAAIRDLRGRRYDAVLDLQGLLKSAIIARATGAPRVIGFAKPYLREPLARFFYSDLHHPGGAGIYAPSETRHVVQINLEVLRELGVEPGAPEFPIADVSSAVARDLAARAGSGYALLNPGAAWPNKRWPADRLAALACQLHERRAMKSVVLWGPGERTIAEDVVARAGHAAVLSPQTTIADVVALARGAAVMVSGDTGPTHIGAAVGTPLVGLYGPTRPERNGPWLRDDITVSRADRCECHHLRQCKASRMCLLDIGVDEVAAAVERRLAAGRAGV